VGKSAMMPPYGKVLSKDEIRSVIAYIRAIAVPPYSALANSARGYSEK
jgi:mono/diheme cytochrome c family protein